MDDSLGHQDGQHVLQRQLGQPRHRHAFCEIEIALRLRCGAGALRTPQSVEGAAAMARTLPRALRAAGLPDRRTAAATEMQGAPPA